MQVGIDVVHISDIEEKIHRSNTFVHTLLSPDECKDWYIPSLAGKIAAKEAIIKTGFISPGEWLSIKIINDEAGKPTVYDAHDMPIEKMHISISHTDMVCVAIALYEN